MSLYPVISQRLAILKPGDIDDCAVVATIWASRAADPCARRPSIPEFRSAAGNPDDPYRPDGLTNGQIAAAIPKIWPLADSMRLDTKSWSAFMSYLDKGQTASIAVHSGHLPSALRFGFYGNHRVGIEKHNGVIYLANPLAVNGSKPVAISESALKYAMTTLIGAVGWILAVFFKRQPVHLRFGAIRTSPMPDRTRVNSPTGAAWAYSTPLSPSKSTHVGTAPMANGTLFVAYQRVKIADGRTFYGDHRGTKWVNASRLSGRGGTS